MNIILFGLIIAISLSFIFLGYAVMQGSADIFQIAGFTMLFILGVGLLPFTPAGIDYRTGTEIVTIDANTTIENYTYDTYQNGTIGFVLSVLAFLGFVNVYFNRKGGYEDDS